MSADGALLVRERGRLPDRWAWIPGPAALGVWLVTRTALFALLAMPGVFYPWDWFVDLLWQWSWVILGGGDPYAGEQVYPPLAMVAFLIPGVVSASAEAHRTIYALFILATDLGLLLWMRRAERSGFRHAALAYAIAIPAIGPNLLVWRFDLLPMLCQIAATVCAVRGMRAWSWGWLGIGIALKLYLLALVPLWILWEVLSRDHAVGGPATASTGGADPPAVRDDPVAWRLARGLSLAFGPVVALAAIAFVAWGPRSLEPYTYSFGRGITIDSTAATLIGELGRAGIPVTWAYEPDCFCPVRTAGTAIDAPLKTMFSLIGIAGVLAISAWYAVSASPVRLLAASAGVTLLAAFASPLLSPQHLVWPLAPLALLAFDARGRLALLLAMIAAATAAYTMWGPLFQGHVAHYTDLGRALLLLRAAAELGAVLVLVFPRHANLHADG